MSSARSALPSSTDLAVRLSEDAEVPAPGRGVELQLVFMHEWLDRSKRGELTVTECRIKQACWEWFSSLSPSTLQNVRKNIKFFIFNINSLFFEVRYTQESNIPGNNCTHSRV